LDCDLSASILLFVAAVAVATAVLGSAYSVWQLVKLSPL
jgi:hypothetical protein